MLEGFTSCCVLLKVFIRESDYWCGLLDGSGDLRVTYWENEMCELVLCELWGG